MQYFRALVVSVVFLILMISNKTYAGPFTDTDKWGDLFLAGSVFYAYGMAAGEEGWQGTIQLTSSIAAAQLTTEALKRIVREERPNGENDMSFPSGHSAGAFSGAMFVHKRYGWKPAIVPYLMSAAVAWSRVDQEAHYWHDVIAGAVVSAIFTFLLVDEYNVQISATPESVVIGFSMKF